MKYSDKLRLPQWQQFRRWVLEEKGNVCEGCAGRTDYPQVHHAGYVSGREPWEYGLHEVRVLCEACHETIHEARREFDDLFAALHWKSLTLLLRALSEYAALDPVWKSGFANHIYAFFKRERDRVFVEGADQKTVKEREALRWEVRNILLSFDVASLENWLRGMDILKQQPEAVQLEVVKNLCDFVKGAPTYLQQEGHGAISLKVAIEEWPLLKQMPPPR